VPQSSGLTAAGWVAPLQPNTRVLLSPVLPALCTMCLHMCRYEGHIWESKKQVYLGAYDTEALAGMAHGKAPLLWHAFTTQPAAAGRAGDAGA
jgi:hypothetical protein